MSSQAMRNELILGARAELARLELWYYCQFTSPEFYKPERKHLVTLCNTLQDFKEGKILNPDGKPYTKLMIKAPPQHGKSRTLIKFTQWCLGKNQEERIITASYDNSTSGDFSKYTRDGISEVKEIEDYSRLIFSEIFPDCNLKKGSSSYYKWALEGQHFNYLGVGTGGAVTGKGATIRICDDLIKNAEEALNELHLDKLWRWFVNTFSSRNAAEGGKVLEIIVMTPWSQGDPIGRLEKTEGERWYKVEFPVIDEEENMLCEELLDREAYEELKSRALQNIVTSQIFYANYHNKTIDVEGRLYKAFKTYTDIPRDANGNSLLERICSYTDTADTGEDFLCSIIYGVYRKEAYILDILYTKDPMEITEPETAKLLHSFNCNLALVESNSGGRGFARAVERELQQNLKNFSCIISWFHQSSNKRSRILTQSAWVQQHIYYPVNWPDKWPEYYEAMISYQKEGKNKHDDAPDATTGIAEFITEKIGAITGPVTVAI
jgi:predicted phage terminase large subunit-like protein